MLASRCHNFSREQKVEFLVHVADCSLSAVPRTCAETHCGGVSPRVGVVWSEPP